MVIQLVGHRSHSNSKTLRMLPTCHPPTCTGVPQVSLGGGLATEQCHSTEMVEGASYNDLFAKHQCLELQCCSSVEVPAPCGLGPGRRAALPSTENNRIAQPLSPLLWTSHNCETPFQNKKMKTAIGSIWTSSTA